MSKQCRASAASEEQLERTSHSQASSLQLSGQHGTGAGAKRIMASLTHVQDFSCTKTTLSAIGNWFKQHGEVMQMHAAFAEQNPRGHAGMQARSIVLVTHALMKLRMSLKTP